MERTPYASLTNVHRVRHMPWGSILSPPFTLACCGSGHHHRLLGLLPRPQMIFYLPTSHLSSLKSMIHFYLIFMLVPMLPIYYAHLSCHLPLQKTSNTSTAYSKICVSYSGIHSPLPLCRLITFTKNSPRNSLCSRRRKLLTGLCQRHR